MKKVVLVILELFILCGFSGNVNARVIDIDTISYEASLNETSALKSLHIDGVNFDFKPDLLEYEIEVPYSVTSLKIDYEVNFKDSIVEIVGGEELFLGNNSVAIMVTSGYDGSVREYDLSVIRKNDVVEVQNKYNEIENALHSNSSSTISVDVRENAEVLPKSTSEALKESLKVLVYNWKDSTGKFLASLSIDGSKVKNNDKIIPNIKRSISDEKLKQYVEGYEYTPLSTKGTNLPNGTVYKIAIEGNEDIYYLYYYDKDVLVKRPLRNLGGTVEFEIEDGFDYALMVSAQHPNKSTSKDGVNWILPSILVTVLVILIFLMTKTILVRVLKTPSIPTEEELEKKKNK